MADELVNANPLIHTVKKIERSDANLSLTQIVALPVCDPIDSLEVYELLKDIKDPEHPNTLEELGVIDVKNIGIESIPVCGKCTLTYVVITFTPTVPHCSMAALIGLCIRVKLMRTLPRCLKIKIYITEGTHNQEESVNKQLNDKERVAAALENPNLLRLINSCLSFKPT
ncbi:MIP18 family protein [Perkinsela sp. CCAP 1560/4]|nr:MIP18 family protein [Perkinsela sp. CCAP 1560/4]|eukprot:KNH03800.1 MIP18 family protein [Perkinsela sp. CCAP 1560/4]